MVEPDPCVDELVPCVVLPDVDWVVCAFTLPAATAISRATDIASFFIRCFTFVSTNRYSTESKKLIVNKGAQKRSKNEVTVHIN